MKSPAMKRMPRLTRYFFEGLLFVAPIAVTAYVFFRLFILIDRPLGEVIRKLTGATIPGAGFVATVVLAVTLLTLVGFLSANLLTRGLIEILDRQFGRFPLVRLLHSSVKDLLAAFVGDKKKKFDRPVLVALGPGSDVKLVGFVTRATMEQWGMSDQMAVYVPMAFNFGGNLVVVPCDRVIPLNMSPSDAMAFVMSGGITGEHSATAA